MLKIQFLIKIKILWRDLGIGTFLLFQHKKWAKIWSSMHCRGSEKNLFKPWAGPKNKKLLLKLTTKFLKLKKLTKTEKGLALGCIQTYPYGWVVGGSWIVFASWKKISFRFSIKMAQTCGQTYNNMCINQKVLENSSKCCCEHEIKNYSNHFIFQILLTDTHIVLSQATHLSYFAQKTSKKYNFFQDDGLHLKWPSIFRMNISFIFSIPFN